MSSSLIPLVGPCKNLLNAVWTSCGNCSCNQRASTEKRMFEVSLYDSRPIRGFYNYWRLLIISILSNTKQRKILNNTPSNALFVLNKLPSVNKKKKITRTNLWYFKLFYTLLTTVYLILSHIKLIKDFNLLFLHFRFLFLYKRCTDVFLVWIYLKYVRNFWI